MLFIYLRHVSGLRHHITHHTRHSALSAVWSGCSTWTVSGTWHSSCPWRWGPSPSRQHCHPPSAWCQTFNINPGVQLSMIYVTLHIDSCWVSKQNPEHPGDFFVLVAPLPLHLSSKCKINKTFEDHFRNFIMLSKYNIIYPFNVTDRSEWQLLELLKNTFCIPDFFFKLQHSSLSINSLSEEFICWDLSILFTLSYKQT